MSSYRFKTAEAIAEKILEHSFPFRGSGRTTAITKLANENNGAVLHLRHAEKMGYERPKCTIVPETRTKGFRINLFPDHSVIEYLADSFLMANTRLKESAKLNEELNTEIKALKEQLDNFIKSQVKEGLRRHFSKVESDENIQSLETRNQRQFDLIMDMHKEIDALKGKVENQRGIILRLIDLVDADRRKEVCR